MLWCLFCFFAVRCWRRGCFGPRAFVLRVVFLRRACCFFIVPRRCCFRAACMSARFVFVRRRCVVAAFIFALVILASGAVAVAGVGACLFQVGPVGAHVRLEVRAFVAVAAAAAAALSLSRGLRGWWSSVHARRAAAATTAEPLVLRQADAGVPEQHAWRSRSLVAPATPAATRHWQSRPCALTAMHTDGGPLIVQAVTGIT